MNADGAFPLVCSAENAKRFAAREGVTWVLEMAFCNPFLKAPGTLQLQVIHAINSDRVFYVPSFHTYIMEARLVMLCALPPLLFFAIYENISVIKFQLVNEIRFPKKEN